MPKFMILVSFLVRQNVVVKVDCFFSPVELMSKITDLLSDLISLFYEIITVKTHAHVGESGRNDSKYEDK